MNINAKTRTVPNPPRPFLDGVWLAIALGLRKLNAGYNDYSIRELMGELTPAELAREAAETRANEEWNRLAEEFWGWC